MRVDITWEENLCLSMFCVAVVMGMSISSHTAKVTFPSCISAGIYAVTITIPRCKNLSCFVEFYESLVSGWASQKDR